MQCAPTFMQLQADINRMCCYWWQHSNDAFVQFTTMLRLPDKWPKKDKMRRMDKIIDELDIRKCLDTSEWWLSSFQEISGISGKTKVVKMIYCLWVFWIPFWLGAIIYYTIDFGKILFKDKMYNIKRGRKRERLMFLFLGKFLSLFDRLVSERFYCGKMCIIELENTDSNQHILLTDFLNNNNNKIMYMMTQASGTCILDSHWLWIHHFSSQMCSTVN